ncbi:AMP-binding protein [Hyphomonas sp.]|uniref:AMP-binding protein n=1 Tax=Hyphomonas sp. TaxID=87 RepID=UPI003F6EED8E
MPTAHKNTYVLDRIPALQSQPVFAPEENLRQIPDVFNASSLLDRVISNGRGLKPAIRTEAGDLCYNDLLSLVDEVAHFLVEQMGVVPGDPVLLQSPNTPRAFAAWWAVMRIGAVAVSIMPMLRADEIAKIAAKAKIQAAITTTALFDRVSEAQSQSKLSYPIGVLDAEDGLGKRLGAPTGKPFLPVATSKNDPALLAFTSGTTGMPKGCVHYHRDIQLICEGFLKNTLEASPDDVLCCTAPMAFTFGLGMSVIFPVAIGACSALPSKPGYEALADALDDMQVSLLATAPTAYRVLAKLAKGRFERLEKCVSAGEHLSAETFEMWQEATGLPLIDGIVPRQRP